eukprot:TRINITY_DN4302_c0_g1_i3.p1 TRINITY_DN4302_c0_g1~~TRINITY_DN4302_c0_g1_i3.p1  ORF type:complete len:524 (-),score=137.20 TRINITY_DN4302_c0_g1_i3:221-1792(-)
MRLSDLWRPRWLRKGTTVKPFEDTSIEARPDSAPAVLSPRSTDGDCDPATCGGNAGAGAASAAVCSPASPAAKARPATTAEETRPLCSPKEVGANSGADASPASQEAEQTLSSGNGLRAAASNSAVETAAVLSGTAGDLESPETVNFDAPMTDVLANVEAAFGQTTASSLKSSKWDKRVQALKAIGVVLKGLELGSAAGKPSAIKGLRLRDRTSCWRATCQVLHHCIRDKVIPVRLASHELFCEALVSAVQGEVAASSEVCHAARVLLGPLLDRLGDSNLRIHESARNCVLTCAKTQGLLGIQQVLAMLRDHLAAAGKGRERNKVHLGTLDTVNFLLPHFQCAQSSAASAGKNCWTPEDVAPFVLAGLEDALGPRVRSSAVSLAVALRAAFGKKIVEPLLEGLRPAVQTLLREKFAEVAEDEEEGDDDEDEDPDGFVPPSDLGGLCIFGSAIKASEPSAPLPGSVEDEDALMDGILEETGEVFKTTMPGKSSLASDILDDELLDFVVGNARDEDGGAGAIEVF